MPRGNSKTIQHKVSAEKLGGYFNGSGTRNGNGQSRPKASWSDINSTFIVACIVAADRIGMALLFGHNRENTALALGIFYGGDKNTFYFAADEGYEAEVERFMWELTENCNATADAAQTP